MAGDANRWNGTGRLTREPELRTTSSGTMVLNFGIANNERRLNQQTNRWDDYTNYFDCTIFGKQAESLARILQKGMFIIVEGKLRWSSWERDGKKNSKVEIIVDEVILPPKNERNSAQKQSETVYDDEIPF